MTLSFKKTLNETGMAVVFTALTLAIGVSTWAFSALKFQADMGLLLAFMFMINMVMAVTVLPALAVVLEMIVPRKEPPRHLRAPSRTNPLTGGRAVFPIRKWLARPLRP